MMRWSASWILPTLSKKRRRRSVLLYRIMLVRLSLCVIVLAALTFSSLAQALTNQLKHHPSPYLALHGDDPVAWQEWNAQTLALARSQKKLLYVSLGYFSCHWCHVMQRESYRNPQIAALLNQYFIPVKVDRELAAALDSELQSFAERTRGQAGWPLNVFITPQGYPLFATLYSPPKEFLQIVVSLRDRWAKDAKSLQVLAQQAALPQTTVLAAGEAKFAPLVGEKYRTQLIDEALAQADMFRGGFGATRKFPMTPQLIALLEAYRQKPHAKLGEFLRLTLDQMASQGLYDHVAGGFFRYTTDPDWHLPHFEKMLYDNTQLARLYLRAAQVFNVTKYREIGYATLDFMLAEMRDEKSRAFITSTSAIDTQNREGGVYLWDKETLQKILTPAEFNLINKFWGLESPAEFDLGYLPMQRVAANDTETRALTEIYRKLKVLRAQRGLPKDGKLLTALNGLALQVYSEAAQTNARYAETAQGIRDFLVNEMWTKEGLRKAKNQNKLIGEAELEDYAYVSAGLLSYAELTGKPEDKQRVSQLARLAWQKFYIARGWRLQQDSLLARETVEAMVADGATPSPASVLIQASWKTGDKTLRGNALSALNGGYAELDRGVFWYATQVAAMNDLQAH